MKSKLLIMIADNITAADVSNKSDISYLSFHGKRSMPITDKASIDRAVEHIRDFYNVDNFEEDTDVVIIYDKLSSEMIEHFASSFVGCDKLGVISFERIIPEIIRNRKAEPPAALTFDHSSFDFGEKNNVQPIHIEVEINDLLFLYYVDSDYFDGVSKKELDELNKQLKASNKDNSSLKTQVSQLSEQIKNLKAELSSKNDEIKELTLSQVNLQAKIDAEEMEKQLLSERSIVYVDIPDNVWNAHNDWNEKKEWASEGYNVHLYLRNPHLTGIIKKDAIVTSLFWSFRELRQDHIEERVFSRDPFLSGNHYDRRFKEFIERMVKNSFYKACDFVELEYKVIAGKTGRIFRLIKATDEITEQNQAIAVIGNENDTREDINKWLVEIGRSDLKCV